MTCDLFFSKESSFYGETGYWNFVNVMFDLFLTGSETTSGTMVWTVLYCLHHPAAADRARAEIDAVVGRGRLPSVTDREQVELRKKRQILLAKWHGQLNVPNIK